MFEDIKYTLENTQETIQKGQSREIGNIGKTRQKKSPK
jgi:hypothetical protein